MIDIIMPAYNAHETIHKTLFSICMQDIVKDIKVYIVDDCSEKTYDYLIDDFKDKLDITLTRLDKNSGPGACRNKGLDISNNEYIMFIDADDMFINRKAISDILKKMDGKDLGIGLTLFENPDKSITYYNDHDRCLHGKMYRRSLLDKYNIRFNNSYRHEDSSFHEIVLMSQPKYVYSNTPTYFYKFNDKSLTHDKDENEEYRTFKSFVENTMYAINKGIECGFDRYVITDISTTAIMYLYYMYQVNYNLDIKDELFEWMKPLTKYYLDNCSIISPKRTLELYHNYSCNYRGILVITFKDFISKALKYIGD